MEVFNYKLVAHKVPCKTKEEVLQYLGNILKENDVISDLDVFLQAIWDRENMMSTGVGLGLAVPHGRTNAANELKVAVCSLEKGIEFESIDDEPVNYLFMIAVPEDAAALYMKVLAAISKFYHMPENQIRLSQAQNADELFNIVKDIEDEINA